MQHISNENNITPLRKAMESVKEGTIRISSGWIRSSHLRQVLTESVAGRIRKGKVRLQVLIRIGSPDDLSITDPGVIAFLEGLSTDSRAQVEWRYSAHHHAKMYIADSNWAMMGSFNLTGGGFGTEARPGNNPEAGVILDTEEEVEGALDRFDAMWSRASALKETLAGFVANEAANDGFYVLGVRPLPAGMFIQTAGEKEGEIILAKVERSLRYHGDFFSVGEPGESLDPELFKQFTSPRDRQNMINGIAWAGDKEKFQLHIAEAVPVNTIVPSDRGPLFEPCPIPPRVASAVHEADYTLLKSFFNPADTSYAHLDENEKVQVSFDDDEILSKHLAVLGSTGSGKSYFVKKYLEGRLRAKADESRTRIVIIDTHGEYGKKELTVDVKEILEDKDINRKAQAVFIESPEDVKEILGSLSKEEKKILKEAFAASEKPGKESREAVFARSLKDAGGKGSLNWHDVLANLVDVVKEMLEADGKEKFANRPLLASVAHYLIKAEDYGHINDGAIRKAFLNKNEEEILDTLKSKMGEKEVSSTLLSFAEQVELGDYRLEGLNLIGRIKEPGIYRLDLSGMDDGDIRRAVCGDLMREVFEESKRTKDKFKTLFIVDEAQNYAPEKAPGAMPSFRWMKTIASEGRKFGTALLVMTQRPAYLSKDILTQCNSQAIFRLINKADISQVEQSVEGISEFDLLQLPNFVAGQAIFTGVGMKMPVRVRVRE